MYLETFYLLFGDGFIQPLSGTKQNQPYYHSVVFAPLSGSIRLKLSFEELLIQYSLFGVKRM